MIKTVHIYTLLAVVTLSPGSGAQAGIVYSETIDGELSDNLVAPTALSLPSNPPLTVILNGQVGNNGNSGATDGSDADYFSFTLSGGVSLESIQVISSTTNSFFGYTAGNGFSGQGFADVDGFALTQTGAGELLDDLVGSGASLSGDIFSFWIQETEPTLADYSIQFTFAAPVPVPAAFWLFASGLVGLAGLKRSTLTAARKTIQ